MRRGIRTGLSRLSLRWRLSAAFGMGLLLVVSALAIATWNLSTGYMLAQREQSATQQAEVNVRLVERAINAQSSGLDELLTGLATGPDSTILLYRRGRWLTSGRQVGSASLPPALLDLAHHGSPARQRLISDGIPVLAVSLPVNADDGVYIELYPLLELDRTFRYLSTLLVTGTLSCALLGVVLGAWASRRALRPLTALTAAASRVAAGDLGARLPQQADPDLAPLATTFNATAEALEQRVKRDARFATDVSHELRSPLTTMVNVAEVLERRQEALPDPAKRALRLLLAEVRRFRRMVVDLLEISSADQQAANHSLEVVDLVELVRNIVASRRASDLEVQSDGPPPLVAADRRRLDRVVDNLLDNAERYGGGAVRAAVLRDDGKARIEIDDNGPGVPPDLRDQVFERFARGAFAGRRGPDTGSGLGLAIVADHVRRHHGTVWVEDRPGGGARFVVELPEAG
ncbi:sensor histidine kinase [Amycolatopsis sp. H20-H5]|uniref:sensor histidine kinase n=1 Tax=Amycolatopsis sp. H20-H5 TaxID=3046309 RepID=UPI002DB697CD|nr:HAMP domain-containing sensor histidine kinase [Amycolatopsis sp. H20-H5]MEC3975828.1 HAMP domain-containing sensor histidine kinase [Amycolatopsis sp. H20-H5]